MIRSVVLCGAIICSALFALGREWTDSTGKYKVDAELINVLDGQIRLKTRNGRIITVPIRRLSGADQSVVAEYVAAHSAKPTADSSNSEFNIFMGLLEVPESTRLDDFKFSLENGPVLPLKVDD